MSEQKEQKPVKAKASKEQKPKREAKPQAAKAPKEGQETRNLPDSAAFPTYKGKPLVRCGDTIYYGDMRDKYVIKIDIRSKKKMGDLELADKVSVQLMYTDPEIRTRKQIVKTSEKNGLYLALDIADAWLSRALAE